MIYFLNPKSFNCIARIDISILVAMKNTLTETLWNVLCAYCTMTHIHSHQFYAQNILWKNIWRGGDSDFQGSGQVKFAKFTLSTATMVAPRGSLNSWNHLINDRPLYQGLLQPQIEIKYWKRICLFCHK